MLYRIIRGKKNDTSKKITTYRFPLLNNRNKKHIGKSVFPNYNLVVKKVEHTEDKKSGKNLGPYLI